MGRAGKEPCEQEKRYRADVRERLTKGVEVGKAEALREAFAVGSEAFREQVRKLARRHRETVEPKGLAHRMGWKDVLKAVAMARKRLEQRCDRDVQWRKILRHVEALCEK